VLFKIRSPNRERRNLVLAEKGGVDYPEVSSIEVIGQNETSRKRKMRLEKRKTKRKKMKRKKGLNEDKRKDEEKLRLYMCIPKLCYSLSLSFSSLSFSRYCLLLDVNVCVLYTCARCVPVCGLRLLDP